MSFMAIWVRARFSREAALAEAGAPYEFRIVSLEKNEQKIAGVSGHQSERQDAGAEIADGEIVTESLGVAADRRRSLSEAALLPARMRHARSAIAGSRSWRARSIRWWRSPIFPPASRRKAMRPSAQAQGSRTHPRTHAGGGTRCRRAMAAQERFFGRRSLCRNVQPLAGMPVGGLAGGPFAENLRHRHGAFRAPCYCFGLEESLPERVSSFF